MEAIPDGWRLLNDGEIIPSDCRCFGKLSNGDTGWGKPPDYLVGEIFCDGFWRHPGMIAIKEKENH